MLRIFRKKSEKETLEKEHKKLLEKAFKLSKIDRSKSDALYAEAAEIEKKIANLEN